MGKVSDVGPRKVGQITVLLNENTLKQKEIATKLRVSAQTVSNIKKKLEYGHSLSSNRVGKCGRKKKKTPREDRRIIQMALKDRRVSCRRLSSNLAAEGISLARRTVNGRLLDAGLKAYRPRKKPRLTVQMKRARNAWAQTHIHWTSEQWEKVRVEHIAIISFVIHNRAFVISKIAMTLENVIIITDLPTAYI